MDVQILLSNSEHFLSYFTYVFVHVSKHKCQIQTTEFSFLSSPSKFYFHLVIFMLRQEIWPKSNGASSSYEILKARIKGCVPDNVGLDPLPLGADMYTGANILEGSLVLSPAHLENTRFSLHPLFRVLLFYLGLHPMQLNPNSYLLISSS